MFHYLLVFYLFNAIFGLSLTEENQLGNAFISEDEPGYLYMDTRATKNKDGSDTEIEARRRSTMARNFVRLGRRDMLVPLQEGQDNDYDEFDDEFARTTRGDKSDHFIRFGRGHSDFVRFGRSQPSRSPSSYFRLGRSAEVENKRSKRSLYPSNDKKNSNSFVRFGRTHNFMRFGRVPQEALDDMDSYKDMQEARLLQLLMQLSRSQHQDS